LRVAATGRLGVTRLGREPFSTSSDVISRMPWNWRPRDATSAIREAGKRTRRPCSPLVAKSPTPPARLAMRSANLRARVSFFEGWNAVYYEADPNQRVYVRSSRTTLLRRPSAIESNCSEVGMESPGQKPRIKPHSNSACFARTLSTTAYCRPAATTDCGYVTYAPPPAALMLAVMRMPAARPIRCECGCSTPRTASNLRSRTFCSPTRRWRLLFGWSGLAPSTASTMSRRRPFAPESADQMCYHA